MAASHENLSGADTAQLGANAANGRDVLEHRDELDATLPPTPVRELLAASGATVFVLATDAAFITTTLRAAGDRYPLVIVESWAELKQAVDSGRCGIALLDAAVLGPRVTERVAMLAAHADRLVTLVAADRAVAQQYVGLLGGGVHRLLIKPAAVGATRLLIESATARRLQLREAAANDDVRTGVAAASSRFRKWGWAVGAGVCAVALLGAALAGSRLGWLDRFGVTAEVAEPAAAAPAPAPAPETAPTPEELLLAEHRAGAALALREGRFAEPAGDNALDHYLAVLALEPTDQAARNGVASVVQTLFSQAEEGLLADSLEGAATALDHVRRVDPASSRLAFLDAQLARSLAALAAPAAVPAARPPAASAPTELESVLSLATARLRRGQLLSPAGDSAQAYLDRAAELNQNDPRVTALRADLAAALLSAARLVSESDVVAATNLVADARRLGGESAALVALERDLGAARAQEEQGLVETLGVARERVQEGTLFAPANDSALAHLSRLQTDAPDLAGLAEAWAEFRRAGVLAIQSSIAARAWAAADANLQALSQAPGGALAAAPLATELAARRRQEAYLATATPASELKVRSSAPVVYPMDARHLGVEGWVDLEFVVDRDGQPRNLEVVQSSPANRFDSAAIAAVERYRYVPFELDGRVYERRVRLRVRFKFE